MNDSMNDNTGANSTKSVLSVSPKNSMLVAPCIKVNGKVKIVGTSDANNAIIRCFSVPTLFHSAIAPHTIGIKVSISIPAIANHLLIWVTRLRVVIYCNF